MTGTWNELEDVPRWTEKMWQYSGDGLVVSLEDDGFEYQVVILPENFRDDNQVIELVGEYETREEAEEGAENFMEDYE